MKKFKQILALILAIVVCVAAMPFNAVFTASAAPKISKAKQLTSAR